LKGVSSIRSSSYAIWQKIICGFKSRYRILSCIFVFVLILPTVTHPILKNVLSTETDGLIENRNLNKFEFSLWNFGANFEIYYQDNFPFRNSLVPLYNKLYNKIHGSQSIENTEYTGDLDIFEEPVINELAIAEEYEENDLVIIEASEKDNVKEEEIDDFTRCFNIIVEADNYFNSINKKIIFQVCPEKHYITNRITAKTRSDLLFSRFNQYSNVSFSYPKNEYSAIHENYMIYDEYNSHHNFLGAYISWQDVQRKTGITTMDIDNGMEITEFEIDIRKIITTPFDIICCYAYNQDLPAARKTENIKSFNYMIPYKPDIKIETLHNSGCKQMEFKSDNSNERTLFITGDSFLETQVQYAIKDFEFTNVSHLYNYDAGYKDHTYRNLIKKYIKSADVIVIVIGENNLWKSDLRHNPGLEYRTALILELAKEIYQ